MSIAMRSCKLGSNVVRRSDLDLRRLDSPEKEAEVEELEDDELGYSSSSSIGGNSDDSGESSDEGDDFGARSTQKGPLDSMNALGEVLPNKRGMSKFYSGKSKSFTSLADAVSVSSVKEIAKPEDPYTKRRKNMLAQRQLWDKSRDHSLRINGGGLPRLPTNPSEADSSGGCRSLSSSPSCCSLPPLHPAVKKSPVKGPAPPPPRQNSPWRSFSLSDLQSIVNAPPNIAICSGGKDGRRH